jgi:hypothetical protein
LTGQGHPPGILSLPKEPAAEHIDLEIVALRLRIHGTIRLPAHEAPLEGGSSAFRRRHRRHRREGATERIGTISATSGATSAGAVEVRPRPASPAAGPRHPGRTRSVGSPRSVPRRRGNNSESAARRCDATCKRQGDDIAGCQTVANPRPVGSEKALLADALHRPAERSRTFQQSPGFGERHRPDR